MAIAVIILLGLVAGAFVLKSAPSAPAGEAQEEHGHGHEEAKGHSDDEHHAEKVKPGEGHEDAKDHKDEEHHDKPGEHAEGEEDAVKLSAEQIKSAGIKVEAAGSGSIRTTVDLSGEIKFNEDRTAHVVPRVAGVVEGVSANLGQQVKKGQVLAVVSSVLLSEQRSELLAAQKRLVLARTTHDREKKLFRGPSRHRWTISRPSRRCVKRKLRWITRARSSKRSGRLALGQCTEPLRVAGTVRRHDCGKAHRAR